MQRCLLSAPHETSQPDPESRAISIATDMTDLLRYLITTSPLNHKRALSILRVISNKMIAADAACGGAAVADTVLRLLWDVSTQWMRQWVAAEKAAKILSIMRVRRCGIRTACHDPQMSKLGWIEDTDAVGQLNLAAETEVVVHNLFDVIDAFPPTTQFTIVGFND